MLKRFISYYKPHLSLFWLDMGAAIVQSALLVLFPFLTGKLLKEVIPAGNWNLLITILTSILAIYLMNFIFDYIRITWGHILGVRMEHDMRADLFRHLQKLSFTYFDNTKTGHIMSRMSNDLFQVAEVAHHAPEDLFISLIMIIASYYFMFSMNVSLALISLIPFPMIILWGTIQRKRMKNNFKQVRKKVADINSTVENSVQGIREVQSFTNETIEMKKFSRVNGAFREARTGAFQRMGLFHSVIQLMRNLYYFTVVTGGALLIYNQQLGTADFLTFILYVGIILPPIDRLINFVEQYSEGTAAFERFTEIMDLRPDIEDRKNSCDLHDIKGKVEFDKVVFSYESSSETVLKELSFVLEPGTRAALVGESGAGKSTLVTLIPRFYEADSGSIRIDGIDILDLKKRSLRENIGLVQQNVFLFDSTIRENIEYGRPGATEEEIIEAAQKANIWDFIQSLPKGLDTLTGERGIKLSGGQRQRISLARVFLKNPPILIFDEATSALDNESEQKIKDAMEALSQNRTSITIAHRLSTVCNADIIFVMRDGVICEQGSHQELLSADGYYASLYNHRNF